MRTAVVCDLHGNLPAVQAVLEHVRRSGAERIVVGGDVFPGPLAHEVLAALHAQPLPCEFLRGNGENDVLDARAGGALQRVPESFRSSMRWHADRLSDAEASTIAAWPATVRLQVPGLGAVLCCHATPRDDNELFTVRTPVERLLPIFAATGAAVVVCGHTHMQFDRMVGGVRVVNAGSVGMPYGTPAAAWLLLGPRIELRQTQYDFAAAAARLRASPFPQAAFLADAVLQPPDIEQMTAVYERAALQRSQ